MADKKTECDDDVESLSKKLDGVGRLGHSLKRICEPWEQLSKSPVLLNVDFLKHINTIIPNNNAIRQFQSITEIQDRLASASRVPNYELKSFNQQYADWQSTAKSTLLPHQDLVFDLAKQAATIAQAFDSIKRSVSWETELRQKMLSISKPWVFDKHEITSAIGFAKIVRLAEISRAALPFSDQAQDIISESFGRPVFVDEEDTGQDIDKKSIQAGFSPDLIAFPPETTNSVIFQAGFRFEAQYAPIALDVLDDDPGIRHHPGYMHLISVVEQRLRQLIQSRLLQEVGGCWLKQRVTKEITEKWENRKQLASDNGEPSLELIQYADFMDLKDIIVRKDNWKLFSNVFIRKEHFSVSMERLHQIRIPIAHSRPIGRTQQLVLYTEVSLLLQAMGHPILK